MIRAAFTRCCRAALGVLMALAPASVTIPPALAQPARADSISAPVAVRTFANGLRVAVVEDHAAAVVQTAIWYRFGSLDERSGKTGLAHGLEHMMFRGTRAVSGGGIDDIGARLGADINANTAEDYTHFYFVVPADRLDLALHIEADRMRGLLLRNSDWKLEKGAVLAEYDGDESQPAFMLTDAVRAAAYAGSAFARTPLGERADIARSSALDLRRYYDAYYRPNNATLVVTGDVTPERVWQSAQRYFGSIPSRPVPARSAVQVLGAVHEPRVVSLTADSPNVLLDCAYRIPGDLDRDAAATQVFADIIDNTRSTVYAALVLSQLTFGYNVYVETALHAGILHVVLSLRPGVAAGHVRRVFDATVARLATAGVSPALLQAAKTANARQAIYARDSVSGLGDRYGYALGVEGRDPAVDDRAVEALDAPTLNAAVKRYFRHETAVGILRPRASGADTATAVDAQGAAGDNFAGRVPSGAISLAPWARAGVDRPLPLASKVAPRVFRFANGLRLYVQPVRTNATVFVSGTIDVSPAFDPPDKTGLGGLTADLLQYGSRNYSYAAVQRLTDDLGADIDVGFQFGAHGLAPDLDRLLAVLADRERFPTFPAAFITLARNAEIAGVVEREHSPDARAERAFLRAIYPPNDPILREESVRSLRAITRADLRWYALHYIRPDRTTIVVVGDVDPAAVRANVARRFGDWRNAAALIPARAPQLAATRSAVRYIATQRDTVNVRIGQRAVGRLDPDFEALNLINSVLGADGTFDTRLMHDMRENRGLVYDVSSALSVSRSRGTLEISFSAAPHNVGAAVRLVEANLQRLRTQPIAPAELQRARTKIVAGTLVSEESTQALVSGCEYIARYGFGANYFRTFAARYARFTPADLLRVAQRYIRPHELVQVYEGPPPRERTPARKPS